MNSEHTVGTKNDEFNRDLINQIEIRFSLKKVYEMKNRHLIFKRFLYEFDIFFCIYGPRYRNSLSHITLC